ncbi:MAG TPA: hypothetical protein VKA44_05925 [Gemmatimonadota bacterium]|nr:hypothetical protein [Gemmatimonadota bacterium]
MTPTSPDPDRPPQRCKGKRAAELVSLPYPGTFNRHRLKMQRVWNRTKEIPEPYPEFDDAEEREAFDKRHVLVIPEWGGVSYFGGDWMYSVQKCLEWARGDTFSMPSE